MAGGACAGFHNSPGRPVEAGKVVAGLHNPLGRFGGCGC
jgi:hypothetical protein